MSDDIVTNDWNEFGEHEIEEARWLLFEIKKIKDSTGKLQIWFSKHSGCVFLSDDDYRVWMINEDTGKLEEWYTCPICGCEGFIEDVIDRRNHDIDDDGECLEWIDDLWKIKAKEE